MNKASVWNARIFGHPFGSHCEYAHIQICLLNRTTWMFGHLLVATYEYAPQANIQVKLRILGYSGTFLVAAFEYDTHANMSVK